MHPLSVHLAAINRAFNKPSPKEKGNASSNLAERFSFIIFDRRCYFLSSIDELNELKWKAN